MATMTEKEKAAAEAAKLEQAGNGHAEQSQSFTRTESKQQPARVD